MRAWLLLVSGGVGFARGVVDISVSDGMPELEADRLQVGRVTVNGARSGDLASSAQQGSKVALRLLFRELGRNRSLAHLEVATEAAGATVTGRSSELLFGLAVFLHLARRDRLAVFPPARFAATGTLDPLGNVGSVDDVATKVNAALASELPAGGFLFYPRADDDQVSAELHRQCQAGGVHLRPIDRIDDALIELGIPMHGGWPGSPFRSLEPFNHEHARIFFGRQAEVTALVTRLDQRAAAGRPGALVIGASGAGKSSFCMAGLLPVLARETPALEHAIWRPRDAIAGKSDTDIGEADIARSLLAGWRRRDENQTGFAFAATRPDSRDLVTLAASLPEDALAHHRHVWVVDQFEELFTLGFSAEARIAFTNFLRDLQARGVWIIGTLRSEFYGQYLDLRDGDGNALLTQVFGSDGVFDLPRMGRDALHQVIIRPAELAGLRFETRASDDVRLDDVLLADALATDDALPLLGFTLQQLYDALERGDLGAGPAAEQPRTLTFAAYEALGGLKGAIGKIVEPRFALLDADARGALPGLLSALAVPSGDGLRETARPASIAQWPAGSPGRRLVDALIGIRVLVSEQAPTPGSPPQIRVAHEALFSHWDEARRILQESQQTRLQIEDFRQRADAWDNDGQPKGALLTSSQDLENARALHQNALTDSHTLGNFFTLSLNAEHKREQAQLKRRRILWAIVAAVVLILSGLVWFSRVQWREALAQRQIATRQRDLADRKTKEALLALAGRKNALDAALRAKIIAEQQKSFALSAGLSERLQRLAAEASTAEAQATLARFFYQNGSAALDQGKPMVAMRYALAGAKVSPQNLPFYETLLARSLAMIDGSRFVRSIGQPVRRAAFDTDEQRIVWIDEVGSIGFGDANGTRGYQFKTAEIAGSGPVALQEHMIVSPNKNGGSIFYYEGDMGRLAKHGCFVVSSGSGKISCWNASGRHADIAGNGPLVGSSTQAISVNGLAVVARNDKDRDCHHLLLLDTMRNVGAPINCYGSMLVAVAFSPNGGRLAIAHYTGAIEIFDTLTGESKISLENLPHISPESDLRALAFSPDGTLIAAALGREGLAIWNSNTGKRSMPPIGSAYGATAFDFSHDGAYVVTAGSIDDAIRVWDAKTGIEIGFPKFGHEQTIRSLSFSRDDEKILSAGDDGTIRISRFDKDPVLTVPPVRAVGWSLSRQDGLAMLIVDDDNYNSNIVYRAFCDSEIVVRSIRGDLGFRDQSALSPKCDQILIGMRGKGLIYNLKSGSVRAVLKGFVGDQGVSAFSPQGDRLFTAKLGGHGQVWDTNTGVRIGGDLPLTMYFPRRIAFSADGALVLIGGSTFGKVSGADVFETSSGRKLGQIVNPRSAGDVAALSPDGKLVLLGGWDGRILLFNWRDARQPPRELLGHTGRVEAALFLRTGGIS